MHDKGKLCPPEDTEEFGGTGMTGAQPARQAWIDMARGGCVLLVVLFHVVIWHLPMLHGDLHPQTWAALNNVVGGIRMPLLLLLSGMLASGKVARGRPALRSAAANYWLYVVWLTIYALVIPPLHTEAVGTVHPGTDWLQQLVAPETPLWYIFGLAVFMTGLWLLRRLHVPIPVILAALLVLTLLVRPGDVIALKVPDLAFYYVLGVWSAPWLKRHVHAQPWLLLGAGAVLAVVPSICARLGMPSVVMDLSFVAGNVGKGLGALAIMAMWERWLGALRPLAWVGRRTLSVYVMHPVLLACWIALDIHFGIATRLVDLMGPAAIIYPALLTLVTAAMALAIEQVVRRGPMEMAFELPKPWMARLQRWERGPVAAVDAPARGTL